MSCWVPFLDPTLHHTPLKHMCPIQIIFLNKVCVPCILGTHENGEPGRGNLLHMNGPLIHPTHTHTKFVVDSFHGDKALNSNI